MSGLYGRRRQERFWQYVNSISCIRRTNVLTFYFSCHKLSCPTSWHHRAAVRDMGGTGNGQIFGSSPLSQVSFTSSSLPDYLFPGLRCKQSFHVDRQDLECTDMISCPLRGCNHVWCKLCQQSISRDGPRHSCDGLSELNYLMERRGWKHCPSTLRQCHFLAPVLLTFLTACKTPIEKNTGCNHMMASPYYIAMFVRLTWLCNDYPISAYHQDATLTSAIYVEAISSNPPLRKISMLQLVFTTVVADFVHSRARDKGCWVCLSVKAAYEVRNAR